MPQKRKRIKTTIKPVNYTLENPKISFEFLKSHLWSAADILRGSIDPSEYRQPVMTLLFLKRLNDTFEENAETMIQKGRNKKEAYEDRRRHYFFVPPKARWSVLSSAAENIGEKIDEVCRTIERENKDLDGVLTNTRYNDKRKYPDDKLRALISHFNSPRLRNEDLEKEDIFVTGKNQLKADIDLLQVFAKPLVRTSMFKNKYKSLRLDDVSKALLEHGKLDNKTGAILYEMSVDERKSYCLHDAHLVAELVKVNDEDVLKIIKVIAFHTGLTFEEVCHKGMTGIWKRIINEAISKKISLVGYGNLPSFLRKLYSNNGSYGKYEYYFDENEYSEDEEDELLEYKENSYDQYIDLLDQKSRNRNSGTVYDYSDITYSNCNLKNNKKHITKNKYKGGLVLDPIRGLHHDVYLFDITSLYPTVIINNNISTETVNCSCCKYDLKARVVFDKDLLNDLYHGNAIENNEKIYWICRRRKGLFSKILEELTQKRIQYKTEGKELESAAIKAIINSGYGVFGYPYFKYYDPKVAEVITDLGRQTLMKMKKFAIEFGFYVLYGDTDSLFVNRIKNNEDISRFIDLCKTKLNVLVNHEKTFRKLILVGKKHYIGILIGDEKPVIKGMEAIKSDRPEFIQTLFRGMVKDLQEDVNPIPKLKQALEELDRRQVPHERLSISLTLTKNPNEYSNDCLQKRLGSKLRLKKGDTLVYYKCDKQLIVYNQSGKQLTETVGESDDHDDISYAKYKEILINSVKDIIEILGYSVEKDLLAKRRLV